MAAWDGIAAIGGSARTAADLPRAASDGNMARLTPALAMPSIDCAGAWYSGVASRIFRIAPSLDGSTIFAGCSETRASGDGPLSDPSRPRPQTTEAATMGVHTPPLFLVGLTETPARVSGGLSRRP